ncbi:MAG: acyltransferase family protein [Lachnospiraceae bacterium]|nr:acyltransferase family protein [Lachnospiraceae bacterium]
MNRYLWLDNLKGFTIVLVVMGHCLTGIEQYNSMLYLVRWIYSFHMPLFFVLSGFSYSILCKKGDYTKHLLNIVLIYLMQSYVYIVFNIFAQKYIATNTIVNWTDCLWIIIYPVAHFWYLHVLIILYIFDALISKITKRRYIVLIVSIAILMLSLVVPNEYVSKIMYMVMFFELGRHYYDNRRNLSILLTSALMICCFAFPLLREDIFCYKMIEIAVAFVISIFFVSVFIKKMDWKVPILNWLGKRCIWIYIFHSYFTSLGRFVCGKLLGDNIIARVIICTILGVVCPCVFYKILAIIRSDFIIAKPIKLFSKK